MDARRFRAGRCRFLLVFGALAIAPGCHLPWQIRSGEDPTEAPKKPTAALDATVAKAEGQQPDLPKALTDDRWIQASAFALREPGPSGYFWQHQTLEAWVATDGGHRAELARALANANPVIAGNAAILLARAKDATSVERLALSVSNTELRLPLRAAAVEALAHLDHPTALKALEKLTEDFGQFSGPAQAAYVPRLHAELLSELATRGGDQDHAPFIQALHSPSPEVRRTALHAWLNSARTGFPAAALELHDDTNPAVRGELLAVVAVQRPEQAREILTRGLDDLDIGVRMSAIAGLASLGGSESTASLRKLCQHPSEVARAAAVSGLAKLGAADAVLEAAKDKSWLVRQAAAAALARDANATHAVSADSVALAKTLLHDKSLEVQRRALVSVVTWPLAESGPILLVVLAEGGYQMRKDAARQLGAHWPPAARFPYDGTAEVRNKASAELRQQWGRDFSGGAVAAAEVPVDSPGAVDLDSEQIEKLNEQLQALRSPQISTARRQQMVEQLVAIGPGLIAALERIAGESEEPLPPAIYEDVLPQISPLFAAIQGLQAREMPQRRTAAAQLGVAAGGQVISPLALERLADMAKTETDAVVWQALLAATANDPREPAVDMAYLAIGNGSPEVRRRACNYLATHGAARHVPVLMPVLADLNSPVVLAAVRALGASKTIDDPQPLIQLLLSGDKQLRLEVATSLARLNVPEGPAALQRLSLDADGEVCRRAAVAMGQLGDKIYVPTLLELLSASVDVQNAALNSLTAVTGEDFSRTAEGLPILREEQVRRWQRWYRDQQTGEQ